MITPCIGLCRVDENKICLGCRRTLDEIARWIDMSDIERRQIIDRCNENKIHPGH